MGVRRSYVKIKLTMKSCIWWFSKFEATRIWKITLYMVRTNYIDVINLRKIYADSPNTVVRFLCLLRELYMWRESFLQNLTLSTRAKNKSLQTMFVLLNKYYTQYSEFCCFYKQRDGVSIVRESTITLLLKIYRNIEQILQIIPFN